MEGINSYSTNTTFEAPLVIPYLVFPSIDKIDMSIHRSLMHLWGRPVEVGCRTLSSHIFVNYHTMFVSF